MASERARRARRRKRKFKAARNIQAQNIPVRLVDHGLAEFARTAQVMDASYVFGLVIPTRAKCPCCGFSQKVKKDGTMGRHDIFQGRDGKECAGSGQPYNLETNRA